MTVYFAQTRIDTSSVKIGYTSDLEKRRRNLSVSSPGGVSILASIPGSRETEEYLHEKFGTDHIEGEWFRYSEEIRDFIRDIQNGKLGLIPFKDAAIYKRHSPEEFSAEAIERAKAMAIDILNAEHRGFRDTITAAKHRIEQRYGLRASMLHRILHRTDMKDVSAGVFLHLQDIHQQQRLRKRASPISERNQTPPQSAERDQL